MSGSRSGRITEQELRRRNLRLYAAKLVMAAGTLALFAFVWYTYYAFRIHAPFYGRGNHVVCVLYLVLYIAFARLYGGFKVGYSRISELTYSQCVALVFVHCIMYAVICLLGYRWMDPFPLASALIASMSLSSLWAILTNRLNNRLFPPKATVLVYDYLEEEQLEQRLSRLSWKFDIGQTISIRQGIHTVLAQISEAEAVFISGVPSSERNMILKYCIQNGIQAYVRPKIGDLILSGAERVHLNNVPVLFCARNRTSLWYTAFKRGIDITAALAALLLAWPFMAITALIIKLYDRGPVLYKQCRLTKDGKKFDILKFRSMRQDAEKDGVARLASQHDDRITPIGKLIRACRLDELPQLINILVGDMSLVGPRPERPEIARQYEQEMPEFSLRLQVKAGLTGYAQVYGKYNTSPYDKLQMDMIYIANQSIAQDIKLMLATVKILFIPDSTEGVADGQTTEQKEVEKL